MGADIYGAIEVRDLAGAVASDDVVGALSKREAPWVHCLDLHPLYPGGDYSPLGCLFGIRNWNGWEPVASSPGSTDNEAPRGRTRRCAAFSIAVPGQSMPSMMRKSRSTPSERATSASW